MGLRCVRWLARALSGAGWYVGMGISAEARTARLGCDLIKPDTYQVLDLGNFLFWGWTGRRRSASAGILEIFRIGRLSSNGSKIGPDAAQRGYLGIPQIRSALSWAAAR